MQKWKNQECEWKRDKRTRDDTMCVCVYNKTDGSRGEEVAYEGDKVVQLSTLSDDNFKPACTELLKFCSVWTYFLDWLVKFWSLPSPYLRQVAFSQDTYHSQLLHAILQHIRIHNKHVHDFGKEGCELVTFVGVIPAVCFTGISVLTFYIGNQFDIYYYYWCYFMRVINKTTHVTISILSDMCDNYHETSCRLFLPLFFDSKY